MATPEHQLLFYVIDDDDVSNQLIKFLLEKHGHKVITNTNSALAIDEISTLKPDCIISDISMPELDGLELFQKVRNLQDTKQPTFIVNTAKIFEFDRRRALELGVDGYLIKPTNPETLVETILSIIDDKMVIQFWGVRGTLPVPGTNTNRYGGNTSCVTLNCGKQDFFIFDAGTGFKELSNHLMKQGHFPISAKLFISHPHYDHINAIPFFAPFFMKGNEFDIFGCAHHNNVGIKAIIADQMNCLNSPISIKEFSAHLTFHDLSEETLHINNYLVKTLLLNHPGKCLGFRVQSKNKSFCYITDNELYLPDSPHYNQYEEDRLINFIRETDVLIIDATYSDEEYAKKVGWGHSCISRVIEVADKAKVKLICLFHHDPDQLDTDIDLKLETAMALLAERNSKTQCIAPHEGYVIII